MSISVTQVINDACLRYKDLPRAQALAEMQAVHDELNSFLRFTDSATDVPLVASQGSYALDFSVLRVWKGELITSAYPGRILRQISKRKIDRGCWRTGCPRDLFQDQTSAGTREISLDPMPSTSSLVISNATNTTPIVVTFTQPHGLTTGAYLYIVDVVGNLAANATWPTVTVIDALNVSLDNSVGSGAYVSGGIAATTTIPFLRVHCTVRQTLGEGSNVTVLPDQVGLDDMVYRFGIWYRWSAMRHAEDYAANFASFVRERAKLARLITGTLPDVIREAHPELVQRRRFVRRFQ